MSTVTTHACTDITGFGLLGHLIEVAAASQAAIRLDARRVPVLPQTLHFAAMGIIPEGAHKNRAFYQPRVTSHLAPMDPLEMVFYDPQTSGGLLIAAPQEALESIMARLAKRHYALDYGIIGEVVAGEAGTITVE